MGEKPPPRLKQIEADLRQYPNSVWEEYERARSLLPNDPTAMQTRAWAQAGLEIAQQAVRSWEAAAQYYRVSPKVLGYMPFEYFVKWAECGSSLCQESPTMAAAFFEASPGTIGHLRAHHTESWSNLGRSLYKGTWKSSTLACKFFASSPALLDSLSFSELEQFVTFLDALSHRSYELSAECLSLGQNLFPMLREDRGEFISLASTLVETGWRDVKSFFEASSRALPRVESGERMRFLRLAVRLVEGGTANVPGQMSDMSQSLSQMEPEHHAHVLALSESLLDISPPAVPEFIKGCPPVLERINLDQFQKWFDEGVGILKQNREGGLAYFKVESTRSEEVLENLSSGVEFPRVKDVMEMYCRGLAGAEVKLASTEELVSKNIGWVSGESPSTEGSTVYVPMLVDRYTTKEENFSWFKVVSTHQVGHLEFDSFRFEFETPSALFKDLRQTLERKRVEKAAAQVQLDGDGDSQEQRWATDLQRFFNLFDDRKLALDIFTVVEDGRLDARVKYEYPGIRGAYSLVQSGSLEGRPDIQSLPAREAMVEFLIRLSLQQDEGVPAPKQYVKEAGRIARIARRVLVPAATVESVAEASLRVYAIISQIPNEQVPAEEWEDVELGDMEEAYADPDDMEQLLEQMSRGGKLEGDSPEEYESSQEVEYRGDFKPELAQLLTMLRMEQDPGVEPGGEAITQEMLEKMLENSAELDLGAVQGAAQNSRGVFANNLLKEAGINLPQSPQDGQGPLVHMQEEGGPLEVTEPQTFVYDEWDFRAEDYKPRWCIVRQKTMGEGDAGYYGQTLLNHGSLVGQVRRQFELMVPEMFRRVSKLEDGEDIDIDDIIESLVDIRTGATPNDKFYWRRNKVQRDVAVAFLLDTSASTAEAIDEGRRTPDEWDAPEDPVEYMVWLRTRRGEAIRRSYKRIIDVEKEAIVLLISALEAIGDVYGIFGFSGYGRENVEFYTIKDMEEAFSDKVKQRIDRIAPLHATRMGPAIRHATSKLDAHEARTKLLFLISDGRPQDRGYSREGVEKEYAVHDTKMALDEAKKKDINAFCLTVDKNGHDYLKTMCQDIGYEVLDDVYALPERLLFLYKRLTM